VETRDFLIRALEVALQKQEDRPTRKHGIQPN
jgi:hypothetical protein